MERILKKIVLISTCFTLGITGTVMSPNDNTTNNRTIKALAQNKNVCNKSAKKVQGSGKRGVAWTKYGNGYYDYYNGAWKRRYYTNRRFIVLKDKKGKKYKNGDTIDCMDLLTANVYYTGFKNSKKAIYDVPSCLFWNKLPKEDDGSMGNCTAVGVPLEEDDFFLRDYVEVFRGSTLYKRAKEWRKQRNTNKRWDIEFYPFTYTFENSALNAIIGSSAGFNFTTGKVYAEKTPPRYMYLVMFVYDYKTKRYYRDYIRVDTRKIRKIVDFQYLGKEAMKFIYGIFRLPDKTYSSSMASRSSSEKADIEKDSFTIEYNGVKFWIEVTASPKTEKLSDNMAYIKGCPMIDIKTNNSLWATMYLTTYYHENKKTNYNIANGFKKYMKLSKEKRHSLIKEYIEPVLQDYNTSVKKRKSPSLTIITDKGEEMFRFRKEYGTETYVDGILVDDGYERSELSLKEFKKAKFRLNNLKEDKFYTLMMQGDYEYDLLGYFYDKKNKKARLAAKRDYRMPLLNPYMKPSDLNSVEKVNSLGISDFLKMKKGTNEVEIVLYINDNPRYIGLKFKSK